MDNRKTDKARIKKLRVALILAADALRSIAEDAGDVPMWNRGGDGYIAHEYARKVLEQERRWEQAAFEKKVTTKQKKGVA